MLELNLKENVPRVDLYQEDREYSHTKREQNSTKLVSKCLILSWFDSVYKSTHLTSKERNMDYDTFGDPWVIGLRSTR